MLKPSQYFVEHSGVFSRSPPCSVSKRGNCVNSVSSTENTHFTQLINSLTLRMAAHIHPGFCQYLTTPAYHKNPLRVKGENEVKNKQIF